MIIVIQINLNYVFLQRLDPADRVAPEVPNRTAPAPMVSLNLGAVKAEGNIKLEHNKSNQRIDSLKVNIRWKYFFRKWDINLLVTMYVHM